MGVDWAEFTDGVDTQLRPFVRPPLVGERTWWLDESGSTVACVVASLDVLQGRPDGVSLRVVVVAWSDE